MTTYQKLARQRDETIFQVKKAKSLLKEAKERGIEHLDLTRPIVLENLIKELEKLYEIEA